MITIKKRTIEKSHNLHDITCGRFILYLTKRTHVMGILNRTPDSFSDGGKFLDEKKAVEHIWQMVEEGADIVDIGGESTRPGAEPVGLEEELKRVIPIIEKVSQNINVPISIDTRRGKVAEAALEAGASIVNDVTALQGDEYMRHVVARRNAAVILMHMKGAPQTMQLNPEYKDLISEIISYLEESVELAKGAGIREDRIIIDPGIGFGKTTEHNLAIIKNLNKFNVLKKPILIGTSRKSFIGNVLNLDTEARLMGTAASVAISILNGADIIRVHDVKQMAEVARLTDAVRRTKLGE